MHRKMPSSGIYRLALYSRHLDSLGNREDEYISSQELAEATGNTAAQVRKDLTYYGSIGEPGKGYKIKKLRELLMEAFGKKEVRKLVVIGAGNLGMALIAHSGFRTQQFKIVAAFDRDARKIGKVVENVMIYNIQNLETVVARTGADIALVCVPYYSAQKVIDKLVLAGVKAILNFAPAGRITVPEGIKFQNVDMSIEADRLYYLLKND